MSRGERIAPGLRRVYDDAAGKVVYYGVDEDGVVTCVTAEPIDVDARAEAEKRDLAFRGGL